MSTAPKMVYLLMEGDSDGCTYTCLRVVKVFADKTAAEVAEIESTEFHAEAGKITDWEKRVEFMKGHPHVAEAYWDEHTHYEVVEFEVTP